MRRAIGSAAGGTDLKWTVPVRRLFSIRQFGNGAKRGLEDGADPLKAGGALSRDRMDDRSRAHELEPVVPGVDRRSGDALADVRQGATADDCRRHRRRVCQRRYRRPILFGRNRGVRILDDRRERAVEIQTDEQPLRPLECLSNPGQMLVDRPRR